MLLSDPCSGIAGVTCVKAPQVIPGATHLFEEPGALKQVARLAAAWFVQHRPPLPHPCRALTERQTRPSAPSGVTPEGPAVWAADSAPQPETRRLRAATWPSTLARQADRQKERETAMLVEGPVATGRS